MPEQNASVPAPAKTIVATSGPTTIPEQVFLAGQQVGRGRHSGVDVSVPAFHLRALRDRRIVVMQTAPNRADALKAAGLREWETPRSRLRVSGLQRLGLR
jgi:hypothetical protein